MSKRFALGMFLATAACITASVTAAEPSARKDIKPEKTEKPKDKIYPAMGSIERLDPALDKLIAPEAFIEKLASGFEWSEGPVWDRKGEALYFSDVPNNVVFKWQPGLGTREFLFPSGFTGASRKGGEQGSNGLTLDKQGRLILCQHGDRQVGRLERNGKITTLAQYYKFRRLNSPNDLAYKSNGDLYFTDPPYGLAKLNADPAKELTANGVYRLSPKGEVTLLISNLTFPNGIAFSPNEKILYVAVSDPKQAVVMAYDVQKDGTTANGRVFFDATALVVGRKGLPDGLKTDRLGNVWTTGPGGVLVLSPEGKHLGTINTGEATANCAFGGKDGSVLYMTADMYLCRLRTLTKGAGW